MRNPKMNELKDWLKVSAKEIRTLKADYKNSQRGTYVGNLDEWKIHRCLTKLQYAYRHNHIAYSELLGRTREQIEPKLKVCPPDHPNAGNPMNPPNEVLVQKIKDEVFAAEEVILQAEAIA